MKSSAAALIGPEDITPVSPEVSIIVLNYNSRRHLETCLRSLAELDFPEDWLETLVVDNASTDDSVAWLSRTHPGVKVVLNNHNLGFAGGTNRGAQSASGDYLAFLNPDMRVDSNWLAALVETVRSAPDIACAGSVVLDWSGKKVDYVGRPHDALNLCPASPESALAVLRCATDRPVLYASGGAMLVRRDVFLDLGGFDDDFFMYNEDVDLGWRLWLRGYRVVLSTRSLVFHRGGASSRHLPPEQVMCMAQKYALQTVLQNMGDEQLWAALPGILWFLVDRSRWFVSARLSLGQAVRELIRDMDSVWQKRQSVQASRVRADAEVFSLCGYPFQFLQANPTYHRFKQYLQSSEGPLEPVPDNPAALSALVTRLLCHAYKFNYEKLVDALPGIAEERTAPAGGCESSAASNLHGRPTANLRVIPRWARTQAESIARRILPPTWRHSLAPFWRRLLR